MPERHAGQIKAGQRVHVRVESETKPFAGTVTRINPQIDPTNRTFEVEVSVANPDHALKPGAFARAEIETFVQPDVLFVPERAVVSFAGVRKVYSVKDGKAVEIPLDTGVRRGDWVEVVRPKGLKPGDPVVVEGVNRLAAGVPVAVSQAATASGHAARRGMHPPRGEQRGHSPRTLLHSRGTMRAGPRQRPQAQCVPRHSSFSPSPAPAASRRSVPRGRHACRRVRSPETHGRNIGLGSRCG